MTVPIRSTNEIHSSADGTVQSTAQAQDGPPVTPLPAAPAAAMGASQGTMHGDGLPLIAGRLRWLRCLDAVARHGSVARGAEALCQSPSSVTRSIAELEAACGLVMFERGARGMTLTVIGARAARHAQRLFTHLAEGAREALAHSSRVALHASTPQRFASGLSSATLRAFLAVAAAGSEARAAGWLALSQPTVHRSLHAIEERLGTPLLKPSARGTRLTDAGQALLHRARLAVAEARAIESELAQWQGRPCGRVVIGSISFSTMPLLTRTLEALRRERPQLGVTVVDGPYDSLMQRLHDAEVDVVVGALRSAERGVRQECFYDEPLAVIARCGHPCANLPAPTLADLHAWGWILPLPGTPASELISTAHAACGLTAPVATLHSNSAMFTRSMLATSDLLAVAPRDQSLADEASGLFRRLPVALPGATRPVGAAVRASGQPSAGLLEVLGAMRDAAAQLQAEAAGDSKFAALPASFATQPHERNGTLTFGVRHVARTTPRQEGVQ